MEGDLLLPVRDTARTHAPDRYMAALLVPRSYRDDLVILAAFLGEMERIPRIVREPALGEIRLQWWRDWLNNLETQPVTGNPIADAMGEVIVRHNLPRDTIADLIDVRTEDFYSDPVSGPEAFLHYIDRSETGPFHLAASITGAKLGSAEDARLCAAARAYGAVRCLLHLPFAISRGRWPLPVEYLDIDVTRFGHEENQLAAAQSRQVAMKTIRAELARLRAGNSRLSRDLLSALLPAALIEPYLQALQREENWLQTPVEISPLTRVWRLWRAWRRAKL